MALKKLLRCGFRLCDVFFLVDIAICERFLRSFFHFEKSRKIDFFDHLDPGGTWVAPDVGNFQGTDTLPPPFFHQIFVSEIQLF